MLTDPLAIFQQEACDLLSSDPAFANVPVINENVADTENQYERSMGTEQVVGGKQGVCVIVALMDATTDFAEIKTYLNDIHLTAFVEENVDINRNEATGTMQTARALAIQIANLWQLAQPLSCSGPITLRKPTIQRLFAANKADEDVKVTYQVHATAKVLVGTLLTALAAPTITNNAGTYTLASATPGAAIFYTLDGTNVTPRAATLYTAPITPATGLTLKTRAFLAGYLNSPTTTQNT